MSTTRLPRNDGAVVAFLVAADEDAGVAAIGDDVAGHRHAARLHEVEADACAPEMRQRSMRPAQRAQRRAGAAAAEEVAIVEHEVGHVLGVEEARLGGVEPRAGAVERHALQPQRRVRREPAA